MKLSDNRESNLSLEPELNQSFSLQDSYKKKTKGKRKLKGPDVGTEEWGNESEDHGSDSENSGGSDCYVSESEEEEKEINEGIYHYHYFYLPPKNPFYLSITLFYFVNLWEIPFLLPVVSFSILLYSILYYFILFCQFVGSAFLTFSRVFPHPSKKTYFA